MAAPALALLLAPPPRAFAGENAPHFSMYVSQGFQKMFKETASDERTSLDLTFYNVQVTAPVKDWLALRSEIEAEDSPYYNIIAGTDHKASLNPFVVVAEAQVAPTPRHRFRVGLIRQPFSFYNEYRSIGILYPFTNLPWLYQPLAGTMNPNLRGVAYQYTAYLGDFILDNTLYGGMMEMPTALDVHGNIDINQIQIVSDNLAETIIKPIQLDNLFGGQSKLQQEDWGLTLSAGGFHGWKYDGADETPWYSWVAGAQINNSYVLASGEWNRVNDASESYYGFLGIRLPLGLMATGIADRFYANRSHTGRAYMKIDGLGLNWEAAPEFVVKAGWEEQTFSFATEHQFTQNLRLMIAAALF